MEERRADCGGDIVLEIAATAGADRNRLPGGEIDEHGDGNTSGGGGGGDTALRSLSFGQAYKTQHRTPQVFTAWQTVVLSFQSLGIVYGDLGTSPLYVFPSVVLPGAGETDFLGILSLILWTLTAMSLVKYVLIVLRADDHGEGGTFALYSLLRQHVNFKGSMPVQVTRLASDLELKFHSKKKRREPSWIQKFLEGSPMAQSCITYTVLVGTCMVMGDGALTPAISVLSAVQGIQSRSPKIEQKHVVMLTVAILLLLFLLQQLGTSRVSFTFSPIMLVWFGSISMIGLYNIIKHYPPVLKAASPHYIYYYFARNGRAGWEQLGAIILCITGAEAMFADLGHFNKASIQVAFSAVVYPSLILGYSGQAAYLIKNPGDLSTAFYSSIPGPLFWPMFVVSTLAAIVASQSLISASFSIIRQSIALGCFPRATVRHTSGKYEGQVYCPEVNYLLMVLCILITVGFQGGPEIGHAFGVAVIWVMLITTALMTVVMVVIWEVDVGWAAAFFVGYLAIEGMYMSSLMNKVAQGGWVPFAITVFFLVITLSWTYGRRKKSEYEASHMIAGEEFAGIVARSARVPGVCFFFTDLMNGIPPIVRHYAEHTGCLRELLLFVTVRTLPVRSVLPEERFLVAAAAAAAPEEDDAGHCHPAGVYRSVVQYGYMDKQDMEGDEFLGSVVAALKEQVAGSAGEAETMDLARSHGVSIVIGRTILEAGGGLGWFRRFVIDHMYRFLQKNFRSSVSGLKMDHAKTLQVGMRYKIDSSPTSVSQAALSAHTAAATVAAIAFLSLLLLLLLSAHGVLGFTRSDFPEDFVFGAATSAYQYEGAVAEDGRSPSIWDTFAHAGKMVDNSTGDVAADGYHKYKDDVKLMTDTNLEAYRFSISWSRLIPNGRGAVNPKGLAYYNNLINELVKRGIQVHVMLYQLDFPQVLDDEYAGWLSPKIVEDFTAFADVCFREFGDRVSHWTTIDEPNVGAIGSYDTGQIAPGHCSDPFGTTKCAIGDSTVEPYVAAHNMILAHASAIRLYRGKYQAMQKGVVGINIYSFWVYPLTNSTTDLEATKRCLDFMLGWILEPLVFGDYPQIMKKIVGSRLPSFTKVQSEAVKGTIDSIGLNHYYSLYVNDLPLDKGVRDYALDMSVQCRGSKTDPPVGKYAPTSIPADPEGLQLVLQYLKEVYGDLPLYIQETGAASSNDTVQDTDRVEYLKSYIGSTLTALRKGVNVKGYFTWSFVDVFEFLSGYQSRYGLYRVDFEDVARPRQARLSAPWYSGFLKKNGIHVQSEIDSAGSHSRE